MQGHTSIEIIDSIMQLASLRTAATAKTKIITPLFQTMLDATLSKMWPAINAVADFDSARPATKTSMILESASKSASIISDRADTSLLSPTGGNSKPQRQWHGGAKGHSRLLRQHRLARASHVYRKCRHSGHRRSPPRLRLPHSPRNSFISPTIEFGERNSTSTGHCH